MRLIAPVVLSLAALAADDTPPPPATAAVEAFHAALAAGEQDRVLALLASEVVIFEEGGVEASRAEYASHHLPADMEFSKSVPRKVLDQRTAESEGVAWVLTRSESVGTFRGKAVALRTAETILLRKAADGWRIHHIHWSSEALKKK